MQLEISIFIWIFRGGVYPEIYLVYIPTSAHIPKRRACVSSPFSCLPPVFYFLQCPSPQGLLPNYTLSLAQCTRLSGVVNAYSHPPASPTIQSRWGRRWHKLKQETLEGKRGRDPCSVRVLTRPHTHTYTNALPPRWQLWNPIKCSPNFAIIPLLNKEIWGDEANDLLRTPQT